MPYTVTHRPVGAPEELVVSTGQTELPSFSLVKTADAATIGLYGLVIVLVSALLPLALLILLINLQRRLPRPSTMVVARVPLVSVGGELRRVEGSVVTADDLVTVEGTRTEYRLPAGLTLRASAHATTRSPPRRSRPAASAARCRPCRGWRPARAGRCRCRPASPSWC